MNFNDTQLGIADRNLRRPVIGDDDRRVFRLAHVVRCTPLRVRLHVVVKVDETFRPSARGAKTTFPRQGHPPKLPSVDDRRKRRDAAKRR